MEKLKDKYTIFVVNTGSTSTKGAIYLNAEQLELRVFEHKLDELNKYPDIWAQYEMRLGLLKEFFSCVNLRPDCIVGIGGLLKPLEGGTYLINEKMVSDARLNIQGSHASNMGCAIAYELSHEYDCPAFTVDPVSVDEMNPIARYSGHPLIERRGLSHALNIHSVVRIACRKLSIPITKSRFIVAHIGGGTSIAPVVAGRIIDVNDASSDGPFTPERTGGLPLQQFISLCFSGKFSESEIRRLVMGNGGLVAYLGTNSAKEVEKRINAGDDKALKVYEAMAYQIAKEIGAMSTVLNGRVDAIILTGGLARSSMLMEMVEERIGFIGHIVRIPGENEMQALAEGALRALRGEEKIREY
ncbi:MAG: butyrate kinase [Candidatus Kryptoniota bacterium]